MDREVICSAVLLLHSIVVYLLQSSMRLDMEMLTETHHFQIRNFPLTGCILSDAVSLNLQCIRNNCHIFTVRLCKAYTHGIAVEILSVRLSVCPSVKRVYCDKTKAPSEKKFNYD